MSVSITLVTACEGILPRNTQGEPATPKFSGGALTPCQVKVPEERRTLLKDPHRMGRVLLPDPTKDTLKDYHSETHFGRRIEY